MSNSFYNHSTYPTPNAPGSSANMRAELDLITAGFNKLPTLSGNGYKVAMINAAGTALIASSDLQQLALTQSTIDSTPIGGTTRAAGAFTTLSANSTVNLGSAVTIAGGVIDGTVIGGTTPAAGTFTTVVATSMTVSNLTATTFTGNLVGNVTGNVTGDLTGNVSAGSGTSTFNNVTINGTLDMNAGSVGTITGLATPTNSSDAAPKGYVDTQRDTRLALAGGTMSGAIAMGTNRITGLGDPSSTQDAATKNYTDTQDALKLSLTGGTMSGAIAMGTNRITGVGDPVGNQDAATKAYVDSVAQGLDVKASVRAATTDNITLSGTATIDSVALSVGDRVLVKNQTTASQNGIYVVSAGGWGRAPDMDAWAELPGAFVFVEDGSVNDNSGWVCTVAPGGTIGTTAVTFEQFSGAGQITAGAGMTKSGNTLNVGTASTARIVVNADNIDLALSGVTAGTYRSVTVDGYGRVTGGTNPTTLAGYGITDAYTTTQVDSALALKLNLSGGTMSGNIAMGSNRITGLPTPSASGEAATKGYADDGLALKLNLTGGTMSGAIAMGGSKITGLGEPTLNQDAVTLNYVTTLYGSTASAAASASAAATSATNAATSATNASNSASAAASSATAAAASFDSFDDRYLGPKSSDPTVDNDGNALLTGALYWNTSLNQMKAYSGSAWLLSYVPSDFYLPLSGGTLTGPTVLNVNSSSDALRITQLGSGNALYIEDVAADATPFVVSSTGVMGIGTTTPDNITSAGIALVSNNGFFPQVVQRNKSNDTTASYLVFDKDRAGSIVQNGDALGAIVWRSFDGANYLQSAAIIGYSGGAPGTNDVPGYLSFLTTPDGASSPIERMSINNAGAVTLNAGTANGVAYLNGSKVLTTGSALTFDGANLSASNQVIAGIGVATANFIARSNVTNGGAGFSQFLFGNASGDTRGFLTYSHAAEAILFGTSAAEQMRLTSTGLGIGTSSPGSILDVVGSGNPTLTLRGSAGAYTSILKLQAAGGGGSEINATGASTDTLAFKLTGTEQMRLTSTGLGIGTSSPSTKLDVVTASGNSQLRVSNGTYYGYFGIDGGYAGLDYAAPSGGHRFRIGGSFTTAMTLDASGNLLVGTTSGDARLYVVSSSTNNNTGTLYALNTNTTADACVAAFATATNSTATSNVLIKFGINSYSNGSGQINANGSGAAAFGSFSDRRLKENIVDLPSQLNNICALRPVEFDYIESEGGGHQIGFIAQEMQEVYPDAVGERGDGMLTVTGWDKTAARLVAAIQEQQAIIEQLKARLDAANL